MFHRYAGHFSRENDDFFEKYFAKYIKLYTFAIPNQKWVAKLRYGVMVALQILALSVRVRVLLSQQNLNRVGDLPKIMAG